MAAQQATSATTAAAPSGGELAAAAAASKPGFQDQTPTHVMTSMQQPKSVQLQQQPAVHADCMGCRLTGLALGIGGGGYVASRLFEQPYPRGAHKFALIGVSAGLFALGVGRALGF